MSKKVANNNQMTGEASSGRCLPRKGALRKKRKVTYIEDSSTDDECELKMKQPLKTKSDNTKEKNVETISISSTSDVEVSRKQKSTTKFIESGIRNSTNLKRISAAQQPTNQKQITAFFRSIKTSTPTAGYFDTNQQSKLSKKDNKSVQKIPDSGASTSGKIMDRAIKPHQNDDRPIEAMRMDMPEAIINDDSGFGVSEIDAADNAVSVASQRGTCPRYKVVEGTAFAVDAFRFGDIEGVTNYFLTHYHSDHYIGLKRTFNKPLFASTITAKLVRTFIGVDAQHITEMNIDTEYTVDNIKVMALDANHCPGAVMFLFKFPCGRCTLHTGDFRASVEMESCAQFWNCNIDTVYLDTTYMNEKANFQLQMHSIEELKNHVQRFLTKNVLNKFLIVVGTYIIGKEKVWMSIANTFNIKVWLEETRRKAAVAIYGERSSALRWVVANKEEAGMHVIPLHKINYQMLVEYHKDYSDRVLLGVRPSGWEKSNAAKATFNSRVSLIGVQYSEHSSYKELDRFMRFLRPKKIISTVPTSQSASEMPTIPKTFFYSEKPNEPRQYDFQMSLSNFIRPMTNKRVVREKSNNATKVLDDCVRDGTQSLADYMS